MGLCFSRIGDPSSHQNNMSLKKAVGKIGGETSVVDKLKVCSFDHKKGLPDGVALFGSMEPTDGFEPPTR
jgi:hypothetical protein